MNIGPILRGALGKNSPAESKSLELRTGQVVRGTVLSVSEDGAEAVVEVQGVRLKAALESPLRQGQSMQMQVQPPGKEGLVVLRPMPGMAQSAAGDKGLEQLLKKAGLNDTPDNRELVRLMQNAGMEISKSGADALIRTLSSKPAAVPLAEWVNAAAIAEQRGLPLSGEIVAGLHQAVFGPPVHMLISALEDQLAAWLSSGEGGASPLNLAMSQRADPQGAAAQTAETEAGASTTSSAAPPPSGAAALQGSAAQGSAAPGLDALLRKLQSILGELRTELAAGQGGSRAVAPGAGNPSAAFAAAAESGAAPDTAAPGSAPLPQGGAAQAAPSQGTESWLGRVLKLLGAEHEQQAGRALAMAPVPGANAQAPQQGAAAPSGTAPQAGAGGPAAGSSAATAAQGSAAQGAAAQTGAAADGLAAGPGSVASAGSVPSPAGSVPQGAAADEAAPAPLSPGGRPASEAQAANGAPADGAPAEGTEAATNLASRSGDVLAGQLQDSASAESALTPRHVSGSGFQPPSSVATGALLHELQEAFADSASSKAQGQGSDAASASVKDSLKSVLMQIVDSPDAPVQLQDAARQMVQQLTGQQLLLNTDRTAPFAQVTMFLPFKGPEGEETATVQIQSRRGKRGELDPDNCRLWFDLNMSALGKLMVDVQVSDKKVILQIHSEGEEVGSFLEQRGDEISDAVKAAGYRLVALRTDTYQAPEDKQEEQVSQSGAVSYVPPVYRGVDYRI